MKWIYRLSINNVSNNKICDYGSHIISICEAVLSIDKPYDFWMKDCMMQIVKEVSYIKEEA